MFRRGFKSWCENTSLDIRRKLGLKNPSPLSPLKLASHLNTIIYSLNDLKGLPSVSMSILLGQSASLWSAITVTSNNKNIIIYNPKHSLKRQSNDLMHELSHIIIGHESSKMVYFKDLIVLRDYNKTQEEEADWLAGTLLLPREALLFIRRRNIQLSYASNLFQASIDLIKYRLNITGVDYQIKKR